MFTLNYFSPVRNTISKAHFYRTGKNPFFHSSHKSHNMNAFTSSPALLKHLQNVFLSFISFNIILHFSQYTFPYCWWCSMLVKNSTFFLFLFSCHHWTFYVAHYLVMTCVLRKKNQQIYTIHVYWCMYIHMSCAVYWDSAHIFSPLQPCVTCE